MLNCFQACGQLSAGGSEPFLVAGNQVEHLQVQGWGVFVDLVVCVVDPLVDQSLGWGFSYFLELAGDFELALLSISNVSGYGWAPEQILSLCL